MSRLTAWLEGVSQAPAKTVGRHPDRVRVKPGPRDGGISDERLYQALEASAGLVGPAAEKLGISYSAVYQRVKKDPKAQAIILEVKEKVTDIAVTHLFNQIRAGKWEQIKYWLDRQAKDRGFTTSLELSGPGGGAIPVQSDVTVTILYVQPKPELTDG